ncbi:hypothetical protein M2351_002191 [Azospirillum canadense]|nr:hypothetical protein [Azospirillum canadense]
MSGRSASSKGMHILTTIPVKRRRAYCRMQM